MSSLRLICAEDNGPLGSRNVFYRQTECDERSQQESRLPARFTAGFSNERKQLTVLRSPARLQRPHLNPMELGHGGRACVYFGWRAA